MAVYQSMKDNLSIHYHTLLETLELDPVASRLIPDGVLSRKRLDTIETISPITSHKNQAFIDYLLDLNEESLNKFISALEDTGQKHLAVLITGNKSSILILDHLIVITGL